MIAGQTCGLCATCGTAMRWQVDGSNAWVSCLCGDVIPREFFRTAWQNYIDTKIPPGETAVLMALDDARAKVLEVQIDRQHAES